MDKTQLETLLSNLDWWTGFFTLLVVIGVGGEFVMHIWSSRASGRLISLQNIEAQTLQAEVARLGTVTAEANKAFAEANERAEQLELQAEEIKKQNLELQRRINPRFLTTAEQQTIFNGISPFHGHQIIIDRLGDGEAGPYGDSIIAVFKKAGWAVQINSVGMHSPPTYGVVCTTSLNPDEGVRALISALKLAKIELTLDTLPGAPMNSWIEMLIGLKPIN